MIITLNSAEQKLATYLAKARYDNARSKGIEDLKKGPQDNWQTDLEGIAAEIAACKAFNVFPDTDIDLDVLPVEDFTTKHGFTVDVKATKYRKGKLITALWKKDKACDFYVLVVGEFPSYRIAGVMSGEELMIDERIDDLGHGKTYTAEQLELQPVEEWLRDYGA